MNQKSGGKIKEQVPSNNRMQTDVAFGRAADARRYVA